MNTFLSKLLRRAYGVVVIVLAGIPLLLAPDPASAAAAFESPLKFRTIEDFIQGVLQAFVYIALPIVAFFVVYSGFKFLTAQGNETKLKQAKDNFMYVIIGASLVLGAWALALLIKGTIDQIRG